MSEMKLNLSLYDTLLEMPLDTADQIASFREYALLAIQDAYLHGWNECVAWSGEDHLYSDINSSAYIADRAKRIGI